MNAEQRYFIGLVLVRLVTGVRDFWKETEIFYISRLVPYDLSLSTFSFDDVMYLIYVFEALGMLSASFLVSFIGFRQSLVTVLMLLAIGFMNSQLVTDANQFKLIYSFSVGFSSGFSIMTVVYPIWERFSQQKAIIAAISGAVFIINLSVIYFVLAMINPNEEPLENIRGQNLYRGDILWEFVRGMLYYTIVILTVGLIGTIFLKPTMVTISSNRDSASRSTLEVDKDPKKEKLLERHSENIVLNVLDMKKSSRLSEGKLQNRHSQPQNEEPSLNSRELFYTIFIFGFLSYYSLYYDRAYSINLVLDDYLVTEMIFEVISLLFAGFLFDTYSTKIIANIYIGLLIFHSVCFYNELIKEFFYILMQMITVPGYLIVAMLLSAFFRKNHKIAFSLSAIGPLVANILFLFLREVEMDRMWELFIFVGLGIISFTMITTFRLPKIEKNNS